MAINKTQKSELVSHLQGKFAEAQFVVVVHYRGMSGRQLYDLRVNLKAKNCGMKIAKNTLTSIALKGTQFEAIAPYLKGPTAILYSQDPVSLSKIVFDAKKENEHLQVKIAFFDKGLIEEKDVSNLAKLGSFEQVRASFLGTLTAVQANFARVLQAPQAGLATLFKDSDASKTE